MQGILSQVFSAAESILTHFRKPDLIYLSRSTMKEHFR
jgi:hypothetical protein